MRRVVAIPVLLALVAGCGGGKKPAPEPEIKKDAVVNVLRKNAPVADRMLTGNDLRALGTAIIGYQTENNRPPKSLAELKEHLGNEGREIIAYVERGDVVVRWGKTSGLLAYESAATDKGGPVLLANGQVETMTADELRQNLAR